MAPNKKKKKMAVNPARGFATTSTPSKPKSQDVMDVQKASDSIGTQNEHAQIMVDPADSTLVRESEKALHELSPEQLEKQLEESELQIFIDKYGESTKKNAFRQLSRLQTERRLLRTQADQLKSRLWLPSKLMQVIIDRLALQDTRSDESWSEPISYYVPANTSEDDTLAKIWTLYQLLPEIGFSHSQRELVLLELLRRKKMGTLRNEIGGKDSIWGLEYCFNWFARSADSGEASSYDQSKSGQLPNQRIEPFARNENTQLSAPEVSRPGTPSSQPTTESQAVLSDVETPNSSPQATSEPESDVESDLEPDEMVKKYLVLRTRRFHVSPEDDERKDRKGKNNKPQGPLSAFVAGKTARLDSKIAKIRSDLLFDQVEADRQWFVRRIELAREAADRKRLGINNKVEVGTKDDKSKLNISSSAVNEVEEEATMLGELFSNLPDTATSGDGGMTVRHPNGSSIKVTEFGKWNGMSPRRILEEACRARFFSPRGVAVRKY